MKQIISKLINLVYDVKIHQKIIVFVIIMSLIPIVIMSYTFYHKTEKIINSEVSNSYQQILNQYVDKVNYKINLYTALIENVTHSTIIQDTLKKNSDLDYSTYMDLINKVSTEIDSIISDKYQEDPYDITIYPTEQGVMYYQAHIGNFDSVTDTDWYQNMLLKHQSKYIGLVHNSNLNQDRFTMIRNIPNLKFQSYLNKLGMVKLEVSADKIFKIKDDLSSVKNEYCYILDNNNYVVYSSDSKVKLNIKVGTSFPQQGQNITLNGRRGVLEYKKIDTLGWKVGLFFDNSQMQQKLDDARLSILITVVSLGIILVLISMFFSAIFSKRIEMLTYKMKNVMDGDLEINYKIAGKDEIGKLDDNFNTMIYRLKELINENYVQKLEKREAQLNALQEQINPHFLYNTLEVINSIASVNSCIEICDISQKLGEMFRYNIGSGKNEYVSIRDEIQHIKNYEHIQKIRFDDKIKITYEIPEEYYEYKVIKFILQPIVENCIVHGFKNKRDVGNIRISSYVDATALTIEIEDDGNGISEERLSYLKEYINAREDNISERKKRSVGIKNVHSRLQLYYGEAYGISISSVEGNGTRVTLRMSVDKIEEDIYV